MTKNKLPSQSELNKLFKYEHETGKLFWRVSLSKRCQIGDEAGYRTHGYIKIGLKGKKYYAHRIIWAMVHGVVPEVIDHKNGNGLDNRICNIRNTTQRINIQNKVMQSNNKSGHTGVCWKEKDKAWCATLGRKYLGQFKEKKDAIYARKKAISNSDYTERHGR